jgi:mannan endo-1,4-beta-mannosidase
MTQRRSLFSTVMAALLLGLPAVPASAQAPIDTQATRETRNLFVNMHALAGKGIMFGHQNSLAYGHDWEGEPDRSDVKDVTGKYPAVYGWDIMDIFAKGDPDRADPAGAARLRAYVIVVHARGGVNTFSWHMPNPVNDTDAWNVTPAVAAIVPGGRLHDDYKAKLDIVAAFLASLKDANGKAIPVWFRPFHEHTGAWFWWGKGNTDAGDFVALWRFTAGYLRDTKGLHNLLYAYSTDVFDSEAAYFEFYPGDQWVDMLGYDDYHSIKSGATRATFAWRLDSLAKWARARGKIAALTETGLEAIPDPDWWTGVLLNGMTARPDARGISYVLVWRNANAAREKREHFYAPYRGQASAADFVAFERDPLTLFEPDLPDLYADPAAR